MVGPNHLDDAPPRILVVEDDRGLARLIERMLEGAGLRPVTVGSGDQALTWLAANHADLMLLDYSLPDMRADGLIEALERQGCRVPFIVATGHGSETIAVEMMKRGARDYLVKSMSFLDLLGPQVARVLAQVEKERRLARAEQALRESEERLRTVIEASNAGIWEWDLRAGVAFFSDEVYELTGLSREVSPVDRETTVACIHAEDIEALRTIIREHVQTGRSLRHEFRIVRPNGNLRWVLLNGKARYDADKQPVRVAGSVIDITDRKRVEISLEARVRQQAAVAELGRRALESGDFGRLLDDVVQIVARTLQVDGARICELLPDGGLKLRSAIGYPDRASATDGAAPVDGQNLELAAGVQRADVATADRHAQRTLAGGGPTIVEDYPGDQRFPAPAGPRGRLASGLSAVIHGPAGAFGVLAAHATKFRAFTQDDTHFLQAVSNVLADVHHRNRATEEARQRQSQLAHVMRLNTMGKMVSELAHEINQPLYAIANYAAACRQVLATQAIAVPDEMRQWMQHISDQANRAGEILRRLGEFVRKEPPRRSLVELDGLIRNIAALVDVDARRNSAQIHLALGAVDAEVLVDRVQIEQVIVNLVVNAIEAMQEVDPGRRQVQIRSHLVGQQVQVEVEDAGSGVDEQRLGHLFDAFFTTKSTGMGMGLSISRSIIEAHEGELWATRNEGPGMTFSFRLPLAQGGAHHAA